MAKDPHQQADPHHPRPLWPLLFQMASSTVMILFEIRPMSTFSSRNVYIEAKMKKKDTDIIT